MDDKKVVFEPVSDMSAVSDAQIFSMEVTRPAIENAVYVQKDAVHEKMAGILYTHWMRMDTDRRYG